MMQNPYGIDNDRVFSMKYQSIKGYKYRLAETLVVKTDIRNRGFKHPLFILKDDSTLVINVGYLWDGVSGPTWDTKSTMLPGLVHDALYQAIRLELLPLNFKDEIDELFYRLMIQEGVWALRAGYFYLAVYTFGAYSCVPGDVHIPDIIEVSKSSE